jgi:hypothetical protein
VIQKEDSEFAGAVRQFWILLPIQEYHIAKEQKRYERWHEVWRARISGK